MKRRLLYTILSISLLTVMAGAAIVSPSARLMHTSPYFVGVGVSIIYLVQAILTRKQQMLPLKI